MSEILGKRRKIIMILFCIVLLINVYVPVHAATAVPEAVLDAVDSVVFIAHAIDKEKFSEDEWAYYAKNYPSDVLKISGREYFLDGSGSGFVIKNENGDVLIATNNHVVADNFEDIFVWLTKDRIVPAEVVFAVPEKDLSVVRIRETSNKKVLPLAEVDAQRGEAVYAIGFPGVSNELQDERAYTSEEATLTDGIISAVRSNSMIKNSKPVKLLQMNAAVNPGNSGGPLLDVEGNVIGINTLAINYVQKNGRVPQGIFGAVAVSELRSVLKEYGVDVTVPEESEMTAPTVTEPDSPENPVRQNGNMLLIPAALVTIAVAVLLAVLQSRKKKIKRKCDSGKEIRNAWTSPLISDSSGAKEDFDISITHRQNYNQAQGDNHTVDVFFKEIKIKD